MTRAKKIIKTKKSKYRKFWDWVFATPYSGVPWLVWFYALISCLIFSHGVWDGHLSGFDDHVRMTQVLDWVNGAGWYDRTIERANPPEGFTTIWTRLVDIPTAVVVVVAQLFTDQRTAALIASVVVPFAELGLLMPVARYFARPLVGKNKAWLIVLFLMFTTILNYKQFSIAGFQPGEASHHSWYIILDLALFGAAARIVLGAPGYRSAAIMGGVIAILLAVGIEGFPMIAGTCGFLAAIAWWFNRPMIAKRAMQAMLIGAVGSLVLLPMHQLPSQMFTTVSFAEPSILGPILIALTAVYLGLEYLLLRKLPKQKIVTLVMLAAIAGMFAALLVNLFPQILDGPAAGLSPAERKMALSQHFEALPVYKIATDLVDLIGLVMPTIIALIAGIVAICDAKNSRRRAMYVFYFGITAMCGAFAETFSRYFHHAMTTACSWLLWLFERIKRRLPKNQSFNFAALGVFILLGPFWMLLLPAINNNEPILTHIIFFPGKTQALVSGCEMIPVANYINSHYDKNKLLIVLDWDSSRFLYYTKTRLNFIANYPSHDKFIDNSIFFGTNETERSRAIAKSHDIDLVAVCRAQIYPVQGLALEQQPLLVRLQVGRVPKWLKPVDMGMPSDYVLYEIDKTAVTK